jgi:hypothetical protein
VTGPARAAALAPGLAALLAVALAGCAPRLRPPPPGLPAAPAALLEEVRAAQGRVTSVQGTARVAVDGPDGAGGVEQFLAAERPGRLRVETHDFFGNVLSVLAVDGAALVLYDARERVFYRGAATAENVGRLVPVPLPPEDLVTLLCGSAPVLDGQPIDASPVDGALRLTLRRGDALQRLDVGAGAQVLRARSSRAGVVGLEVELSGHRPRGGAVLPTEVTARAPGARLALSLRWKEVEANGPVDPSLFGLVPPEGARIVDLGPAAR